jgi:hypothetical protein
MKRKELNQSLSANIFSITASRSLYILKMMHDHVIKQITVIAGAMYGHVAMQGLCKHHASFAWNGPYPLLVFLLRTITDRSEQEKHSTCWQVLFDGYYYAVGINCGPAGCYLILIQRYRIPV